MSTILFTYSGRTVKDVVQLHAYLASSLGTSFKYVNYIPSSQRIVVAVTQDTFSSSQDLQQAITDALNAYTDPMSPGTRVGIQTGNILRMNAFGSYTSDSVVSENILDLQGNRIINVGTPLNSHDSVNKAYVDAISTGSGRVDPEFIGYGLTYSDT